MFTGWRPPMKPSAAAVGRTRLLPPCAATARGGASRLYRDHGGEFPQEPNELQELPGIGRYTAGAIASIAFDKRAAILEANTIRLLEPADRLSRQPTFDGGPARAVAGGRRDSAAQARRQIQSGADGAGLARLHAGRAEVRRVPAGRAVRRERGRLAARNSGREAAASYTELREAAVVVRKNGSVLMRRCGDDERWAGLWDFPRFELEADGPLFAQQEIVAKVAAQTGITCEPGALLKTIKHGVTRYRITLDCYEAAFVAGRVRSRSSASICWRPLDQLTSLPLSTTGRKIANLIRR